MRSNANYLRWKFGLWIDRGWTPNVSLLSPQDAEYAALKPGESAIATIRMDHAERPLVLTDARIIHADQTLVGFEDVAKCIWIDRDPAVAAKLKKSKFDRVILERLDGTEVVIEGIGQAVFPLMSFFRNKVFRERD